MNHRMPMGLDVVGEAAKLSMKELVLSNRVFGVLAYADQEGVPVGWTSLDRKKTLPGHDCIDTDIAVKSNVWSIHCITLREGYRNKGLERLMISSAIELARKMGAGEIEAYPEPGSKEGQAYNSWNKFNGFQNIFSDLGFKKIDREFEGQTDYYYPMSLILMSDVKILSLLRQFESASLPPMDFDHLSHLKVAWEYLSLYSFEHALMRFVQMLERYVKANNAEGKFHLTLTVVLMCLIKMRMTENESFEQFIEKNSDLLSNAKPLVEKYYSPIVIGSKKARETFVLPDKEGFSNETSLVLLKLFLNG